MSDINQFALTGAEQQLLTYLPHLFGSAGGGVAFLFLLWRFKLLRKVLIGLKAFLEKVTDDDNNREHEKETPDTRTDPDPNTVTIADYTLEIGKLFKQVRTDQGLLDSLKDEIGKNKTRIKLFDAKLNTQEAEIKEFRVLISSLQILLAKMETAIGFIKDGK